ncbi:protein kinase activity protein [Trebouxia sp. C0009 RCD-2024]
MWVAVLPQARAQPDVGNDTASTGDSGLSVSDNALSPDNNASNLLASPVNGLLPELTPDAMEDGVCLFLLQVSGPSAVYGNEGLCQELSSNLATRLTYVNDSNLFLLNYTQVPSNHRRRILENAAPSSPAPAPLGAIQPGVVALPDLQAEMQNISLQGTGVKIKGPSMTFMYEVFAQDNAYIVNIHNQLNSIIATSVLLKDVQAANLSIYSIYLLDFQPEATIAGANSAFPPPSPRPTSNRAAFVATSVLIPVGVIIIIIAASAVFIWRRRLRHVKGSLESRRSSSIDPADSAQGTSLQMTHANWIESKSLSELPSLSSHGSYPKLAAAHRESHIGGEDCLVKLPPAWIDAVPFSDWEIDVADVVIGLRPDGRKWELGAGAFSVVYRGLLRGVQVVAVKVFNDGPQYTSDSSQERMQTLHALKLQRQTLIKQEIAVLKSCRDRNIVQFVGACIQRDQTMLITEYMEGGDLYHAIAQDSTGRFSWYKRNTQQQGSRQVGMGRRIALDVARGLHFLHSRKIVHFDLKSANILLARDNTAKIADVGLAKIMHRQFLSSLYNVGTFAWSAPEVLLGKSTCTEKVDIYSYGVVLWEICAGEAPTGRQLRPLRVPEECPQATADVVEQCLHEDADVRPSAREIVDKLSQLREPIQA